MPLPIAHGGKNVSSKPIVPPPIPVEEDASDGTPLCPQLLEERGGFALATNNLLSATIAVSYYHQRRSDCGEIYKTVACIRIQVSPIAESFSSRYRDSVFCIDLAGRVMDHALDAPPQAFLVDKYLACIIASQIVIFQLRKPLPGKVIHKARPPLPSYIKQDNEEMSTSTDMYGSEIIIPVATTPRIVPELREVTSICNMETTDYGILLAGLADGRIVVVSYRDAQIAGVLWQGAVPLTYLCHISMGKRGRLVAIDQEGCVTFFESHAIVGTEAETANFAVQHQEEQDDNDSDQMYRDESETVERSFISRPSRLVRMLSKRTNVVLVNLTELAEHRLEGQYVCADWIDSHLLSLLTKPNSSTVIARVVLVLETKIELVTSLTITSERLKENAQASFALDVLGPLTSCQGQIRYHAQSSCLLVSTSLREADTAMPFVCCWQWRSNTTSLVVTSVPDRCPINATQSFLSLLYLAQNLRGVSRLIHVVCQGMRFQKYVYHTAFISPNNTLAEATVREESPVVLSDTSVAFPVCYQTCALQQNELEWHCSSIPPTYLSSGPLQISCIAKNNCRSIAVASCYGLCILDTTRMIQNRYAAPRWRRFDVDEEVQFRTLAMEWWEDEDEELLLAIIENAHGHRHLACWSQKRLDLSHQLLHEVDRRYNAWGVPIPESFTPDSMSLLSSPAVDGQQRRAVLLLTDTDEHEPSFLIFQLQSSFVSRGHDERYSERRVLCSLALNGGLSAYHKNVFLASASFKFDLRRQHGLIARIDDHVAVIGMLVPHQLKAAVATKRAILLETVVLTGTVSSIMLSNVLHDSFHWLIELSDGTAWCWATDAELPDGSSNEILNFASRNATPGPPIGVSRTEFGYLFGTVSCLGESAMWMLGSTNTRSHFAVGCMPSSHYGCIICVGQEGSHYHRTLVDDSSQVLEHEVFSFGRFSLTTPAFVPSLLNHLLFQPEGKSQSPEESSLLGKEYFAAFLRPDHRRDTALFALRLLVLRSIETVASLKKSKDGHKFACGLLSRVIDLLNEILSPSIFSSLILSLARQIEPSFMDLLFPLPSRSTNCQIEDLYLEMVRIGSLAIPSASLPLLSSKRTALEECRDILYHSLLNLSCGGYTTEAEFDTTKEERQYVRDLFRFGNQLEALSDADFWSDNRLDVGCISTSIEEKKRRAKSGPVMDIPSPIRTPIATKPQQSALSRILTPLICSSRRRREERAVCEAASIFISGFDESEYAESNYFDVSLPGRGMLVSVNFVTGKLLVRLSLEEKHGWKKCAAIARLVLGDTIVDESGRGVVDWLQRMPLATLAVNAHQLSKSNEYLDMTDSDELADVVTTFLMHNMFSAQHELNRSDAAWLLELIILCLSRLSPKDSVNHVVAPGLILMANIVGHVSGRFEDMIKELKQKEKNALLKCYVDAKRYLT